MFSAQQIRKTGKAGSRRGTSNEPRSAPDLNSGQSRDPTSERADAYRAEAASLENLLRLARATGMPDGEKPIPWLQERGLVEKVGDGWRVKTAGPAIA